MGMDVFSSMVVGYKVPAENLEKEQARGCQHPIRFQGDKFCSECGKPTWIQEKGNKREWSEGDRVGKYTVKYSNDDGEYFVIGKVLPKCTSRNDLNQLDADTILQDLDYLLREEMGIDLTGASFGLHLVVHACW